MIFVKDDVDCPALEIIGESGQGVDEEEAWQGAAGQGVAVASSVTSAYTAVHASSLAATVSTGAVVASSMADATSLAVARIAMVAAAAVPWPPKEQTGRSHCVSVGGLYNGDGGG